MTSTRSRPARRSLLRRAAALAGLSALALLSGVSAQAQFRVEISGVGATQVPVAISRFRDEDKAPQSVSAVVRADLERSGLFAMVDPGPPGFDETTLPAFADWRMRGADALVLGSEGRMADGRYDVRFRLWDVVRGSELTAQAIPAARDDLRLASHRIADEIYQKLTGEKGVFSTRIAYVSKAGGRYTLWVADADGEMAQVAVAGPEPIISPAWSPDGREVAYVSFESKKAVVYAQDVANGKRRTLANFRGSNSAPAWSPDGSQLAVTLTQDGISQLYTIGRNGGNARRLTYSGSIDTEATWAPDGKSLYFVSDRSGGPQVYRVPATGGPAERITFQGNYNISPAISPDGRYLAYISRVSGNFKLMLRDMVDGTITALTDTNDDESPSFAPNSRLIIYGSKSAGRDVLMTTTLDGRIKAKLAAPQQDVREPVWGPWGR